MGVSPLSPVSSIPVYQVDDGSNRESFEMNNLDEEAQENEIPYYPAPPVQQGNEESNNQIDDVVCGNSRGGNSRRRSFLKRTGTFFDNRGLVFKQTIGYRIRQVLYKIENTLGPLIKKLIPNFVVAHYTYLIIWIILGSIVLYGEKNIEYTDALFQAAGGATQAGLNTVNLNALKLYQQITIYIICMFTTPIFIHSSLVFLRLYWYEKVFDNIKEQSIQQFKDRRTQTLARLRTETMNRQDGQSSHRLNGSEWIADRFNEQSSPDKSEDGSASLTHDFANPYDNVQHLSEPSDNDDYNHGEEEDNREVKHFESSSANASGASPNGGVDYFNHDRYLNFHHNNKTNETFDRGPEQTDIDQSHEAGITPGEDHMIEKVSNGDKNDEVNSLSTKPRNQANIKFADLPKPKKNKTQAKSKRRSRDINPRDLFMSISVLQQQPQPQNNDIESGPALKIKGPLELERENKVPGYKQRRQLLKERKRLKQLKKLEDNFVHLGSNYHYHPQNSHEKINSPNDRFSFHGNGSSNNVHDKPESEGGNKYEIGPSEGEGCDDSEDNDYLSDQSSDLHRSRHLPNSFTLDKITSNFEHVLKRGKRRASFFARTLTGRRNDDENDEDHDLISHYSNQLQNSNYLSWNPTVGRNSNFVTFSEAQKRELGGVEYQAMKLLCWILIFYYVGFHIIGIVFFIPFIETKDYYKNLMIGDGFSPAWWAFFTSQSCFNDLGYTLNPDSMMPFAQNAYISIVASFFIVIGNTGFPVLLRFIIWVLHKFSKPLTIYRDSLTFLLSHPRRCFTLLFPSAPTWWLFMVLFVLNLIDWLLFIVLDYTSKDLAYLPKGYRILAGLFQAISTRTAGFSIVNLSTLNPAILVSYTVMMYISVLPLAISIRRTNVYEEQSLGVYRGADGDDDDEDKAEHENHRLKFIGFHLRRQLSFDLWFLFLAIFIVCICESRRIRDGEFQIFDIMFEITSAYGTVGLSMGFPNSSTSFCGQFTKLSKLVVIATMIRGRHRGLPNSIDRAILLNHDKMNLRDNVQSYTTMKRNQTLNTAASRASQPTRSAWQKTGDVLKYVCKNMFLLGDSAQSPGRSITREATRYTME